MDKQTAEDDARLVLADLDNLELSHHWYSRVRALADLILRGQHLDVVYRAIVDALGHGKAKAYTWGQRFSFWGGQRWVKETDWRRPRAITL